MKVQWLSSIFCIMVAGATLNTAQATVISQWSFPDQGATSNADYSATTVDANAVAGDVVLGSAYTQLAQVVSATNYTYIDSAQNSGVATWPGGGQAFTSDTFSMVGDWDDGTAGNITIDDVANVNQGQPTGAGPGGAGALWLNSPGEDKNGGLTEAVNNNLGITFAVTASGGNWEITDFSFYGARVDSDRAPNRSWVFWYLQVDTGSGFTTLFTSAQDAIATGQMWDLQEASPFSVNIADGDTATFRLIGSSTDGSQFGRPTMIDDITLEGTFVIPEPASLVLLGFGSMLIAGRRRPSHQA